MWAVKYFFTIFLFCFLIFLFRLADKRFATKKVLMKQAVLKVEKSNFLDTLRIQKKIDDFLKDSISFKHFLDKEHFIEKEILKNNAVRSVVVSLSPAGRLNVTVAAKKVLARVRANNTDYYLDDTFQPMELSPFYTQKVLLITDTIPKLKQKRIYKLIRNIQKQAFLQKNIVEIRHTQKGDYAMMMRKPPLKIILGDLSNLQLKLKKLSLFYRWAIKNKTLENYQQLNLKYKNQIVCSKDS